MDIPTVITLSTIPLRFNLLTPTLESLLAQSLPAQAIEINVARRFSFRVGPPAGKIAPVHAE
jgi:hypothetical protein